MFRNPWLRKGMSVALVAGFLPVATAGCFGDFRLTKKVYSFNKSVSKDKWVRWLVFLVIVIVPVYGLAMFIDALLANSIEFWTGKNPISAKAGATKVVTAPTGEVLTMRLRADDAIDVTVLHPTGKLDAFTLVRDAETVVALDAEGREVARVGDQLGKPVLLAAR
jgi:hypothetical protein